MSGSSVFYVLFVDDEPQRRLLDTVRYIANPGEKQSAHVTVRGPYQQRHAFPKTSKLLRNVSVHCQRVGTFFEDEQNTVFLHCEAPEIEEAWRKPDYPDYNPHLTIYDGENRHFAERLADVLQHYHLAFDFVSEGLAPLKSSKGQKSADLASFVDPELLKAATGQDLNMTQVGQLPAEERLQLIDQLLSLWARAVSKTGYAEDQDQHSLFPSSLD